jgi:predicted ATPase
MANVPIPLGPLNFFVGANASGKTNFISALRFLKIAVSHNAELAVNEFGGVTEVRNKILRERQESKPLTLAIKFASLPQFKVGNAKFQIQKAAYEIQLDVRSESGIPSVVSETLKAELESKNQPLSVYRLKRTQDEIEIFDPAGAGGPKKMAVPSQERSRLAIAVGFYSVPCLVLRDAIQNWSFFNINAQVARSPFKEVPEVDLGPAGEYLSVVLHKIEQENGKGSLDSIVSGLRGAIPGFRNVKTTRLPVENKWAFQILEERIRGAINPESASDGTIRLLALMVIAVWSSRHSTLISIEEPENGLHPHLSEHIVSVLREASTRAQVVATTHNPDFLDFLSPEEVHMCDKIDGFTKIVNANTVEQVSNFQSKFRLGELWEQGVLGGIP